MRTGVINSVYQIMKENKNSYFLTGDLGFHTVEDIERDFGSRFINIGVAEQNMIGIASGLALTGKKVFCYSIIPFLTMRCFEQIRNDICYHNLDVTLLGVGSGMSYGILSSTHFALEDVAVLRSLPNMHIFSPADEKEAILGMQYLKTQHYPTYVRIGLRTEPVIYDDNYNFVYGKGNILKNGKDYTIFSTGTLLDGVLKATDEVSKKKNKTATVVNIHSLKPIDKDIIISQSKNKKIVFTVEEHMINGGLGSMVAEIISEHCPNTKVVRIGTEDEFIKTVGTRSYLRKYLSLDTDEIAKKIVEFL